MKRLIIISNRLPITAEKNGNDITINKSVGGLATGMSSLSKEYNCIWIGFSGIPSEQFSNTEEEDKFNNNVINNFDAYPVSLTKNDVENYYEGFSNKTIWPLFHYFPMFTEYVQKNWNSYKKVNLKFFEVLVKIIKQDDTIWIHDYQLMLLPNIIREKFPDTKIGFFLHIPFPVYEIFRLLPWKKEILSGITGSDLIGFHSYSYKNNFQDCLQRILGYSTNSGYVKIKQRVLKIESFPMGIDFNKYSVFNTPELNVEIKKLKKSFGTKKLIISIDRLDYTKGISQRLKAIDYFFKKHPEFLEKVVIIMVTVPSRTQVSEYIELKRNVDELIGGINGKYRTIEWTPIIYFYRSLEFNVLRALYYVSHVALITPLRDGMNLVAKEFIASRKNMDGVIILSEMAGVAEELGEAILVNPNDRIEMANAIVRALTMPINEQRERISSMYARIKINDVFKWAENFINELKNVILKKEEIKTIPFVKEIESHLILNYQKSNKRIMLIDYDGTLIPFNDVPNDAVPDDELIRIISSIIEDERNDLIIISGREKAFLEKHFGSMNLILVAEHGVWIKEKKSKWRTMISASTDWKKEIKPLINYFVERTPGSFIEDKDYSLAWHYRKADPYVADGRLNELKNSLYSIISNMNLSMMDGNKVLEIKSHDINKGKAAAFLLALKDYDFILGIGDDITDEYFFKVLPDNSFSIKVGHTISVAKYSVDSYKSVRTLLEEMINYGK